MEIWLYISTGLFLGWSLGANHAVNVFGTAVVSRMVRFRTAALVAGIFVVLGAVISGSGAVRTLNELGSVNALAGCFTVALAVGLTVTWMTMAKLPVSTSQAVVGGIIGWNLFTGSPTDMGSLSKIVSTWVISPVIAATFAYGLYKLAVLIVRRAQWHILRLDAYTRIGLIVVGAIASYSLAANNIANVMGMFVPATPFEDIHLTDWFTFSGTHQLLMAGGVAIAVGIYTYGYRVMTTVGDELYKITPVAGLVVVLAESIVLFLFASEGLEKILIDIGLPPIPLVPLSSTQTVIGGVIGVGLARGGGKGINYRVLLKIASGWVTAPIATGLMAFVLLFFVQNVFERKVVHQVTYEISPAVLSRLAAEQIPTEPLQVLEGQPFTGSAKFRLALMEQRAWKEKELYKIFTAAELDTLLVDTAKITEAANPVPLTDSQFAALRRLHGRQFLHRWELDETLSGLSEEWKTLEGSENKIRNKELQVVRSDLYKLFRPAPKQKKSQSAG